MALSPRKKVALGFAITGAVFIAVGAIIWNTMVNPSWLTIGLPLVGLVAEAVGFTIILPQLP
jgi:hypothetical protein